MKKKVESTFKKRIDRNIFLNQAFIGQYICPLCNCVAVEPSLCNRCMKLYCKYCLEQYLINNKHKCPNCQKIKNDEIRVIETVKNSFIFLDVKCNNKGCNWRGKFYSLDKHLKVCPKEKINCKFQGCRKSVSRELPY